MSAVAWALIDAIRSELSRRADASKAPQMQAYMKSKMPFYGVQAPQQSRIFKQVFEEHSLGSFDAWAATSLALWREARFREESYAAIALTGDRRYREYQTLEALPIYEEMIVTGAWWDYVDTIAVHRFDTLLRRFPSDMKPVLRAWSASDDLWKKRSSIISQVALKDDTDLELLYACIERNLDDRDFFIRKAIGWALRAYAWIDPDEVLRYVGANRERLSPLSRREALKNVVKARPEAQAFLAKKPAENAAQRAENA